MSNNPFDISVNAAIIPEIWSQKFYDVLRNKLIFMDSISRDYEGEIKSLADTVRIPTIADFSEAIELADGAAGDAETSSVSTQSLEINKRSYKDFIITSQAELESIPFMDSLRDKAIYSIMKRIEAVIIAAISPSSSSPDHIISYDSSTTLALADILEAKELLDVANVPDDMRIGAVGSAQLNDLFNVTGFMSRDFIPAGSPLSSGQIQSPVCGFQIKSSNSLSNTSYWFHPSFMQIAIQQNLNIEVSSLASQGIRGKRVNCDVLYGLKQCDNKRVVSLS